MNIPQVICSSVVRGAQQGESHGGLYRVDFNAGTFEQIYDLNSGDIDFAGRGADRGLRGIVRYKDHLYVAASNEIFCFDDAMNIVGSYSCPYLQHAHEMALAGDKMFIASTGYNSILLFDLDAKTFEWGLYLKEEGATFSARTFDPKDTRGGPGADASSHLNMVWYGKAGLFFSGLKLTVLLRYLPNKGLQKVAQIPAGTHNARPFNSGVVFNDTARDCVRWVTPGGDIQVPVTRYEEGQIVYTKAPNDRVARPHFARGLAPINSELVIAGSSPSTLNLCDFRQRRVVKSVQISKDVRNAIHGLILI